MLELQNISVHFGGIKALNNVSFKVEKESSFSIIGPNGAGKTSLLNVISEDINQKMEIYYLKVKILRILIPILGQI